MSGEDTAEHTTPHDIPMSRSLAAALQALEAESAGSEALRHADPAAGLVLFALVRAARPQQVLMISTVPLYLALWIAMGAHRKSSHLTIVTESGAERVREALRDADLDMVLEVLEASTIVEMQQIQGPFDLVLLDLDATRYAALWSWLKGKLSPGALFIAMGAIQQEERLDALTEVLVEEPQWRQVTIDKGSGLLVAGRAPRPPQFDESPREALTALLLNALQPATLVLGQNVVFDGSTKPPGTRVNFGGAGGNIGDGDLLIAHPQDLGRFSPLPGATALVLGELKAPIRTPNVVLPFGDEIATLIVA
ncbi:MAG: O-methyltransferase [Ardenticatenaceae bacterium]